MITWIKHKINCPGFNLMPKETCPYATPMCKGCEKNGIKIKGKCYGGKTYLQVPNIQNRWRINTEESKKEGFDKKLAQEIQEYRDKIRKGFDYFRFTSYGDVYSQKVYDDFCYAADMNYPVKFLLFTKSYPFLRKFVPKNFYQKLSIFPDTNWQILVDYYNYSWAFAGEEKDYSIHPGFVQNRLRKSYHCPGECDTCQEFIYGRYCWRKEGDVRFSFH